MDSTSQAVLTPQPSNVPSGDESAAREAEVRAPDPAFGQEPGHRGIRGQESSGVVGTLVAVELSKDKSGGWRVRGHAQHSALFGLFKRFPLFKVT